MRSILVAAAAILLSAGAAHAQEQLPNAPRPYDDVFGFGSSGMVAGIPVPSLLTPGSVPALYQLDPRWSAIPLGRWDDIGEKGCYVIVYARIGLKRGYSNDPLELIRYLSSEFVLPNGKFQTNLIDQAFPGTPKPERFGISGFNKSLASRVELELARGSDVTIKLKRGKNHFHLVQVEEVRSNDFLIFDPGRRDSFASLSQRYGYPKRGSEMVIIGPSQKLG
ncbi:MAG TPA: hypothetical protein VFY28_00895 [Candidatus Paceibacterota bacterium]|nr:hypothetical protein [Candidatus Paceibacterota bacterium]